MPPMSTTADATDSRTLIARALRLIELFSSWPEQRLDELMRSARLSATRGARSCCRRTRASAN